MIGGLLSLSLTGGMSSPQLRMPSKRHARCIAWRFHRMSGHYSPLTGPHPPPRVIDQLLDNLIARTDYRCIMTFGVLNGLDHVFSRPVNVTSRSLLSHG
jgi:hypothetical protein